ncbi:MAG TPA: M14 family zinc carboxypeptidase [Pyrinomonadaceae bacterium]|nr:M14 family zinc carboxypeptidase [Pyrinomonadaceae bacterium]
MNAQTAKDFAADWDKQHFSRIFPSNLRHADLKKQLEEIKKFGLKVEEVGRSYDNREIYQVEWGKGATRVFMWSQMHGDEPTATPALLDMFVYLQKNRGKAWIKELENNLTIRAVPMLNPDGAELFQRRNLQSIDINRDAQDLQTPEGQLLKKLRDEWKPAIGFNLHNQQPLTTVGNTPKQATISFLAVLGNAEGITNEGHERNKRICSLMISALNQFIPGHIGRYDDEYNPRAFGDKISEWGTPVILIETGALHGRDEMFLVKLNFIAYLTALKSLVDKSEAKADAKIYETLPFNNSGRLYNYIFRRANIINFAENLEPFVADVSINAERRRASEAAPTYVREVGDLSIYTGLEEFDAKNFYLVNKTGLLKTGAGGEFWFYKKSSKIDWTAKDFDKTFPPDAIFLNGKWTKGEKLLPKKN